MPLMTHSGTGIADMLQSGTKRDDISDVLLSNLYRENTTLGLIPVGEEFVDTQCKWVEDRLNPNTVTETGGLTNVATTGTFSAADCAILDQGYILQEDLSVGTGEYLQVQTVNVAAGASTGTVTFSRAYGPAGAPAATTHAVNAVYRIVGTPTYENSDLGKDMTRARGSKLNYVQRFEVNVNLSSELIIRSLLGYTPGVQDELAYQFRQRIKERKRDMQTALWYSIPGGASPQSTGGDESSFWGIWNWLNGQANTTAVVAATSGTFSDVTINTVAKNITKQGTTADTLCLGTNLIEKFGQLYSDRIRMEQSEATRGFLTKFFLTSMGFELRLVLDPSLNDTQGSLQFAVLDMGRIRIRPQALSFFYMLTAPTLRDGDAIRALSKWTPEIRNTGTDFGYAHQIGYGMST